MLSLDFFRGFTMLLLIAEGTHLFSLFIDPSLKGSFLHTLGTQFHHHPWNGLRFWDLIQPFFMFIVGVALPFSVRNREKRGESPSRIRNHALQRAFLLLLFGWALYCIGPGRITFRFQNVLAQLAVTYLIAFLLMKRRPMTQIFASLGLLLAAELLYRFFPVAGFDQAFVPGHNFGSFVDMILSGELNPDHWVAFNAVPTAAHTIWGVLAGQILLSGRRDRKKISILVVAGIVCLAAGYSLSVVTPIIKRIATSSFVLASGGWALLVLALSYWLIDVRKLKIGTPFFAVVGKNPLFIYLFAHVGGAALLYGIAKPFTMGIFSWTGDLPAKMVTSLVTWMMLWFICWWMDRKRIYIRL